MNKSLLIFALKIIKEECLMHDDCGECPILEQKEGKCSLETRPDCWIIDNDKPCTEQLVTY